ncbi:MAG: tRNA lysidine(34) synthetase TilS [Bacteroidia bacterium]|nr:tRNA lysidine(34) synthetase TilS [Bacteroidia bacterium]MDW8089552.1 tRNA lysidine(34) synthetase TilS [Bacteroidia bacterium]
MVAFSGGPDSVALVRLLQRLGQAVELAYVNHNLRGADSVTEEAWVRAFAEAQGLPLHVRRIEPHEWQRGLSRQAQARRIRYDWMQALLQARALQWAATAHNRDDLLETLLYRLVRSRSPLIWEPIPRRRGCWLRPLLPYSRAAIVAYLKRQGESYLLDVSNYWPAYLRNRLRWWVMPVLQALNPRLAEAWLFRMRLYRYYWQRLLKLYSRWREVYFRPMPFGVWIGCKVPWDLFQVELWRRWRFGWRLRQRLWQQLRSPQVGRICLFRAYLSVRTPSGIEIGPQALWTPHWAPLGLSPNPASYQWGLWTLETGWGQPSGEGVLVWDCDTLMFPLWVRLWRPGDRLQASRLKGASKKVSDIWPEMGWYGFLRRHAFVVEASDGRLVGLPGYDVAYGTQPSPSTRQTFYLRAKYGSPTSAEPSSS